MGAQNIWQANLSDKQRNGLEKLCHSAVGLFAPYLAGYFDRTMTNMRPERP